MPAAVLSPPSFVLHRSLSWVGDFGNLASTRSSRLLVLSKRSSKEMDFLATILNAIGAIAGEYYHQVHWGLPPQEENPLVVHAQWEANLVILREALKVYLHVSELKALRLNMDSNEFLYPEATKLRTELGNGIWAHLENYREAVIYLAFSTLREKIMDENDLPTELKAFLNDNTPHMETYIRVRYGERDFNTFLRFQNSLAEVFQGERRQGIEVQQGGPMRFLKRRFRRQPILWLVYNLNFPVGWRMTWDQVSMWVIQCLRHRDDIEPPTWPIELRGLDGWNRGATGMWNEAVIEVYTDIRRRFCAIERLHMAI